MQAAIVIPAFDEAATIANVVEAVRAYGTPVVVDDGSGDGTGDRAAAAGAVVVRHEANRGYDRALASGFARAEEIGAGAVVTFDADGQLDARAIPQALAALETGPAVLVLGVRQGRAPRFAEALFNLYARLRFGVPDILCGLKGFRMGAYAAHRDRVGTESIHTGLALALLRSGAPFALVEVAVRPRAGRSRMGGRLRANVRILRALFRAIAGDLRLTR